MISHELAATAPPTVIVGYRLGIHKFSFKVKFKNSYKVIPASLL